MTLRTEVRGRDLLVILDGEIKCSVSLEEFLTAVAEQEREKAPHGDARCNDPRCGCSGVRS
jgi:hypothetical protein